MTAAERKLQAVPPPEAPREITAPHVFRAIADVMGDLSREGIAKLRRTEGNGPKYNFRGIDDVYNALAPILAERKLVVTPRCLSREVVERKSNSNNALFYVTVQMEFTLASAIDGSTVTACMYGEALDSGDKATNKAMSAAYKYMAMQQFCIPTEGDNDADATTHEVAAGPALTISAMERAAAKALTDCTDPVKFKEVWERNKEGWKKGLDREAYGRLVGIMKTCATQLQAQAEPAPVEVNDFGIGDDEIPY